MAPPVGMRYSEMAMEYDPTAYAMHEDPYPTYRWLREEAPVYHNPRMGFWALSRFQDVWDATLDWATFSSSAGPSLEKIEFPLPMLIAMDPPLHTRVRGLVSKAFTPRRIAAMEVVVRRLTRARLADCGPGDEIDLFEQLASSMPMDVISTLLGVPEADRAQVRDWSNTTMHREDRSTQLPASATEAMANLFAYYADLIEARRRAPEDDLLSHLLAAELRDVDGSTHRLSQEELLGFCMLLGNAGHETTARLICNAVVLLWQHPEQRAALADDPAGIPDAVEEILRFDPPSQVQGRITLREATLHGVTIPVDSRVLLLTGAASRDEREYEAPDRFDVRRTIDRHLSFGYGQHVCLGKSLARQEARVALEEILRAFPAYEIDTAGLERAHNTNVRGYARVPMRL